MLSLPGGDTSGPFRISDPTKFKADSPTVALLLNEALKYIFPIAGLILLFVIIGSGFQMMTSAGSEEATANAKKSLTNAAIGFGIIFLSFWIYQIIKAILGI